MADTNRMPAEWEPHRATWIAWPHQESDFPGKLAAVQWVYPEIARLLSESEIVEILIPIGSAAEITERLEQNGAVMDRCRLHEIETDRSWLRDSLPSVVKAGEKRSAVGWKFNAWAKYDNYHADAKLPEFMAKKAGLSLIDPQRPDGQGTIVLEGGGIEVDGAGTILVTEEWLLSDTQVRNPGMTREQYESAFAKYLGATKTVWLGNGCVGDDTHGHIDDIARFSAPGVVLLAFEENQNDENYRSSADNLERLTKATDARGKKLDVRKLPYPRPILFSGQRLPASYANFYVANSVVIVPTFNDENDSKALKIIADAFPGRRVVGIHSLDLVWGLGTLHCLTQQEPR